MDPQKEIRKVIRMLRTMAETANHAALTGTFSAGGPTFLRQYNTVLEHLRDLGMLAEKLFPPLEAEVNSGEAALLCAQLAAYLEGELPTREEEGRREAPTVGDASPVINITGNTLGDLSLGNLRELGELIRQHLPAWLKGPAEQPKEEVEEPPQEPAESTPAEPPTSLNHVESQLAELGARLQVLAERMRREDLAVEERLRLADEMSRVGQEQAQLARQHALLRDQVGG